MTTLDITAPLRLYKGTQEAGSGRGCIMNLIAWMNGEPITDRPRGYHDLFRRLLIMMNDAYCTHCLDKYEVCADCSVVLIDAAQVFYGSNELAAMEFMPQLRDIARYMSRPNTPSQTCCCGCGLPVPQQQFQPLGNRELGWQMFQQLIQDYKVWAKAHLTVTAPTDEQLSVAYEQMVTVPLPPKIDAALTAKMDDYLAVLKHYEQKAFAISQIFAGIGT